MKRQAAWRADSSASGQPAGAPGQLDTAPQRIRDAGVVMIAANLCLVVWLAVMAMLDVTKVVAPSVVQNIGQILRGELVVLTGHTMGVLAGFGMLKRRK